MSQHFIRAGNTLIRADTITWVDTTDLERGEIVLHTDTQEIPVSGIQTIDAMMYLNPAALEGRRMRWIRHVWIYHNLVAHPLMQVLALLGKPKLGLRVHNTTVPRPTGFYSPSS